MMNVELSNWIRFREKICVVCQGKEEIFRRERLSALSMVIFLNRSCQSSKSAKASASILEFLRVLKE